VEAKAKGAKVTAVDEDPLVSGFVRQFDCVWRTLREAIEGFPDDEWREGEDPFLMPARQAMHALLCADIYTRPEEMDAVLGRFGAKWWEAEPHELPTQAQLLDYLEEARQRTEAWVVGLGRDGLLSPGAGAPEFPTGMEFVTYAMRHLQHHTGELCAEQKRRGLALAEWR
jgi:hypothetical protein